MLFRVILFLILGMFVLHVFPQDEPPITGDTGEGHDYFADLMTTADQGDVLSQVILGLVYEFGLQVSQDYQGDATSQST